MKLLRSYSGFSLVELVVAIGIVGILAAIAIPSFKNIIENQRIKSAGYDIFSTLILARSEAVKRNRNVTITSASGGWQNGWQITATDGTVITVIKDHAALTNLTISNAPASLIYKRTGRLLATTSPSFQIDVNPTNSNFTRCISIELSGLPRTKTGSCS